MVCNGELSDSWNSLEASFTEQAWDLTCNDVDGGPCHETTNGRSRNEFDEPTKAKQADKQHDEAADKRNRGGDLRATPFARVMLVDVLDYLGDCERHYCDGTN